MYADCVHGENRSCNASTPHRVPAGYFRTMFTYSKAEPARGWFSDSEQPRRANYWPSRSKSAERPYR